METLKRIITEKKNYSSTQVFQIYNGLPVDFISDITIAFHYQQNFHIFVVLDNHCVFLNVEIS